MLALSFLGLKAEHGTQGQGQVHLLSLRPLRFPRRMTATKIQLRKPTNEEEEEEEE